MLRGLVLDGTQIASNITIGHVRRRPSRSRVWRGDGPAPTRDVVISIERSKDKDVDGEAEPHHDDWTR